MYNKILVPLDGSHRSLAATEHAIQIAAKVNANITLLHVAPNLTPLVGPYGDRLGVAQKTIVKEFETMGENILNEAMEDLKDRGVTINKKLTWGNPAQEICLEAREGNYDLIVIGSRGLSEIKGYLMGSVSNRVTRHAHCPVLIIR
ncbi:universal stress protein [Desulfoscipio geothermicus]|uniref:Nucleotide-binding universal stress protein, UspA family n=1 Tax=Desulfoscipio geothermicus DSM 3669 TaxID=1121426 RepID=A0A1I6DX90_9FIRM|nr:universal stress protein [Desulfoscipio geothermicus]SFR10124.1 Nucleotide-binding universal stress protein, UspA family [Desulfoscipio geothermicus DSM 3669]